MIKALPRHYFDHCTFILAQLILDMRSADPHQGANYFFLRPLSMRKRKVLPKMNAVLLRLSVIVFNYEDMQGIKT